MSMIASGLNVWHATILEIIWTLIGVFGVFMCSKNIQESNKSLDALRVMNGHTIARFTELRVIAFGRWRNDLFRMSKSVVITGVGIVACLAPPASPDTPSITPVGVAITVALFAIEILVVLASTLDNKQREMLMEFSLKNDHIEEVQHKKDDDAAEVRRHETVDVKIVNVDPVDVKIASTDNE